VTNAFRTRTLAPEERAQAWEHALAELWLPHTGRVDGELDASLMAGRAGPVQAVEIAAPAGVCERSALMIRPEDRDLYEIDVVADGQVTVEQDGRVAHLQPGDLAFVDPARPVQFLHTATRHVGVLFPRSMLPLGHADVGSLTAMRVRGDRGTGAVVSAMARQLPHSLKDFNRGAAARLGAAVVDLLGIALSTELAEESAATQPANGSLVADIHAYIDDNLSRRDLTPSVVAGAHHVSLRYLHKLFHDQGTTVAGWIRQRRLERCRRDLLDPAQRNRTVSAIAARWGLTDAAHFTRVFKAAYGNSPARYRAAAGA
jgi:AraC-like DNA-binding protein